MQKIKLPNSLQSTMTFHSSYCEKHTFRKNGQDVVKPVQRMVIDGEVVCPRCKTEAQQKELEQVENSKFKQLEKLRKYNTLYKESHVSDETILTATFQNYTVEKPKDNTDEKLMASYREQNRNKQLMLDILKDLKEGQVFNVILQGVPGAGKSHLAYATLQELNNHDRDADPKKTCLFVSVDEMIRLIKDSFNNKESKYTEQYFIDLLSSVDYLVLDDLGAETGSIETLKAATDFVQRVLYGVMNARQGKVTIVTFNLSGEALFAMYDKKVVSRLLRKPRYVTFKDTKDKRKEQLPF